MLHSTWYNQPSQQRVWIIQSPELEKPKNKQVQQEEKNKEVQQETNLQLKIMLKNPLKEIKKNKS